MRFILVGLVFIWTGIQTISELLHQGHSITLEALIPLGIGAVAVFIGTRQIKKKGFLKSLLQEDSAEGADTQQPFPDAETVKRTILEKRQQRQGSQTSPKSPLPAPGPRAQARQRPPQATPRPFVDTLAEQRKEIARLKAQAQEIKKKTQALRQSKQQAAYTRPALPPVAAFRHAFTDPTQLRMLVIAHEVLSREGQKSRAG